MEDGNKEIFEESNQNNLDISYQNDNSKDQSDFGFKLILVDLQEELCEEFKKHFAKLPNVEVVHGKFESLPDYDCIVSAGNSFGLMDGGVDAAITLKFGKQLQKRVQKYILENFEGEQPVGTSFIIQTEKYAHPYLAHTPTMRVPYSIEGTDYVYLAMKAMLNAVKKHNKTLNSNPNERKINSVACTGLGTFYGKMALDEAARQMALAYKNFLNPPSEITWGFASQRQNEVGFGGFQGLQKVTKSAESEKSRKKISSQMSDLAMKTQGTNK